MSLTRQERKSCETCRARKLRCSGEKSGCSRCRSLSLTCRFKDKGAPGRPRKRAVDYASSLTSGATSSSSRTSTGSASTSASTGTGVGSGSIGGSSVSSTHSHVSSLVPLPRILDSTADFGGYFPDLCALPIESWQTPHEQNAEILAASTDADHYVSPVSLPPSCKCDAEVSSTARNLSRARMSHDIIQSLRTGVSLAERLLTCPVCYDVSKPPRVTVQNVLLIGHLMFEVTSGYLNYLRWLNDTDRARDDDDAKNSPTSPTDPNHRQTTVYLGSGLGVVDLQISAEKLQELVMHGLQADVERLLSLGEKFAQRQRNRHMVGHETCPDPAGRCRRAQEDDSDRDPLDVCPHHPVARRLVPCFRIVDEVRGMIAQVAGAVL
ncbi:hypothetical protein BJX64DRAFT_300184 [Aspergillus heterothallicus]